jgi:hypothetical protein
MDPDITVSLGQAFNGVIALTAAVIAGWCWWMLWWHRTDRLAQVPLAATFVAANTVAAVRLFFVIVPRPDPFSTIGEIARDGSRIATLTLLVAVGLWLRYADLRSRR